MKQILTMALLASFGCASTYPAYECRKEVYAKNLPAEEEMEEIQKCNDLMGSSSRAKPTCGTVGCWRRHHVYPQIY